MCLIICTVLSVLICNRYILEKWCFNFFRFSCSGSKVMVYFQLKQIHYLFFKWEKKDDGITHVCLMNYNEKVRLEVVGRYKFH